MWQSRRTERTLCQLSLSVLEAASGSFVAPSLPSLLPAFCSALLLLPGFLFYFGNVQAGSSSSPAGMSPRILVGWLPVGPVHCSAFRCPRRVKDLKQRPTPLSDAKEGFRALPQTGALPPLSLVPLPSCKSLLPPYLSVCLLVCVCTTWMQCPWSP